MEKSWLCTFHSSAAVKKEVYFMAIIDILTHYDAKKKAAHAAKTVKHGVSIGTFPALSSEESIQFNWNSEDRK